MHTCYVIAFLLAAAAAVLACVEKAWPLALIAASIAAWLIPVAFQLNP